MSQAERLAYIDSQIKERGGVTLREIAQRFEISERQARRDLDYLKDRFGAPVEWKAGTRRYEYAEEWRGLDFADEKALLFSIFARAAAGTIAYVPLAEEHSLERLLKRVPKKLRPVESAIRYELPGYEPADLDKLVLLVQALADRRCLDLAYRDADRKLSQRRIEAQRLVNYAGSWYLVAYDHARAALRTFKLSRIDKLSISRDKAKAAVSDAELDRFLGSSYGMFKGAGDKTAVLRFYGRALAVVRDEQWHPAQRRTEGSDPRRGAYLELSLPASRWEELVGRILRFGADAEPVSPPELRELWKAEARRLAAAIDT
ncbi:MAG TPA: WYL domain-containing protein [Spirochaetales bacterium]|nr:WYL domain-containing protein [Spirochaetales bacterium]HRY53175.1 WYL domain-containing protein [Spirochaetia bacterium]HRZ63284.1 WYL domain-containing protein [Spirochaetia bacterium]